MGTQHQDLVIETDHFSLQYVNESVDFGTPGVNPSLNKPELLQLLGNLGLASDALGSAHKAPSRRLFALVETRNKLWGNVGTYPQLSTLA